MTRKSHDWTLDAWVHKLPLLGLLILAAVALVVLILLVNAPPARSQEWLPRRSCEWAGTCSQWRYGSFEERRRLMRQRYYRAPAVYAYERRGEDARDERRGWDCRDMRRAVGDQHLTIDGAKKAANDSWAGAIRFHLGEKFMDLDNARHIEYTCSRSSIKEAGSSVTTLGAALNRCEIAAHPCQPVTQRERREDRR